MEKTGTERDWLSPKIPSTVRKRNGVKAKKKQKERKGWKYNIQKETTQRKQITSFWGWKKTCQRNDSRKFPLTERDEYPDWIPSIIKC